MKKSVLFAAAAIAFVAVPASAADIDVNLTGTNVGQLQNGPVTQNALAVAASVGNAGNNVDIAATAVSAAQLAAVDLNVGQGASGVLNANVLATQVAQVLSGSVDQTSTSLSGTGGTLGNGGVITSTAANLGQSATVNARVRQ